MVRYDKRTAERGAKYVEDRRSQGRRSRGFGRGGGRARSGGGGRAIGGGIGGIIILIIGAIFGVNLLGSDSGFGLDTGMDFGSDAPVNASGNQTVDPDADAVEYMQFLMEDIQATWDEKFDLAGQSYQYTTLVIFTDVVDSGCGRATSAVGPFYCPAPTDQKVYVDLDFFDELSTRFGAPGDFAQAYVIAHEVGHHIQSIVGISDAVRQRQAQDPGNKNAYSIRQELQADCLAGVWVNSAASRLTEVSGQPILEPGDLEEGLAAAAAVGDNRIQAQAGMRIDPHTWTHGSDEQRVRWFRVGFDTGDPDQCDPFIDNP